MRLTQPTAQSHAELAKLLGISEELISSCLNRGHITLTVDSHQTFLRLGDLVHLLRRANASHTTRPQA